MMPRLATALFVNALIRRVNQSGGMAAVLAKGDETAGALILITLEKGLNTGIWARTLTAQGAYDWTQVNSQVIENEEEIRDFCARKRAQDPDLWIVELDIAHGAQFAVELDRQG